MSFNYRFEPPHNNDFMFETDDFDDEIINYDGDELQDRIENYLFEERIQNWKIQELYKRRE